MKKDDVKLGQMSEDEKRALLARLLKEKAQKPVSFPLSYSQQQLWFLDQMVGHETTYNVTSYLTINGNLDRNALIGSMQEIVRRHEVLRTTFATRDDQPVQLVHKRELKVTVLDYKSRIAQAPDAKNARDELLAETYEAEKNYRFDLAEGPLIRVHLLVFSEQEHIMILNIHHIITDGWSTMIMVNDLTHLYPAFAEGKPSPLSPPELQYGDYAKWQRDTLQGDKLEEELAFFRETMKDVPPLLELPTDFLRPAVQEFDPRVRHLKVEKEVTDRLLTISRRGGGTLFMALLAGFQLLMARYSGQRIVTIASPIANRHRKDLEQIVGFFVNSIVLYSRIDEEDTFNELLGRTKKATIEAFKHQYVPFDRVVDALSPDRSLSHNPISQVRFSLKNLPDQTLRLPGLTIDITMPELEMGQIDLYLAITQEDDGLELRLQYNARLFKAETIDRLLNHYNTLLCGVTNHPNSKLGSISHLTQEERLLHLRDWHGKELAFKTVSFTELFQDMAQRHTDRAAVKSQAQTLTYGELNRQSNQLAHFLIGRGIGPGSAVCLYLDQSIALVVSLLGVMKAGACYVPLETNAPRERTLQVVEEAHASLILSLSEEITAEELCGKEIILLDRSQDLFSTMPETNPEVFRHAEALAYQIYTSGSTGIQKGVSISHGALLNYVYAVTDLIGFQAGDTFASPATVAADLWTTALFGALGNGGCIVPVPRELRLDPESLKGLFSQFPLDYLKIVPVHLASQLSDDRSDRLFPRKALICGGEKLTATLVAKVRALKPNLRIINHYGPAEATVGATRYEIPLDWQAGQPVPIGLPLCNYFALVLDPQMNLVAVGIKGELYLGGPSLARGYADQPGLTAERFIPNPFGAGGQRLYRTGDVVKRLAGGYIEFLGRADHQVKIRGFRVELSEIEAALNSHEQVATSLAVTRADDHDNQRLIAFVVPETEGAIDEDILREYIKPKLPDYMMPAHFEVMASLPLTPNGKIDPKRLPEVSFQSQTQVYVAPTTEIEQQLCEIWRDVLKLEQIGVHDNFFKIGGDSILSILVVSRARAIGLNFTPQTLFEEPTIALLARASTSAFTTLAQGPVSGSVPLTPIQKWFFGQDPVSPHHWNQAVVLIPRREVNRQYLEEALGALVDHHDQLRARFSRASGNWEQSVALPDENGPSIQTISMVGKQPDDPAVLLAAGAIQASLSLEEGPLLAAAWLDFGPLTPGRLLLVLHHLVVDGVSWRILLEDLLTAYGMLAEGQAPSLPAKTTSFQQWSRDLNDYAQGPELLESLSFWSRWSDLKPKRLSLDESIANTVGNAITHIDQLQPEETQRLIQEVPQAFQTQINDLLLTGLGIAYQKWTADALWVALEGHGREALIEGDLSRTVGWFTSIFPVLVDLSKVGSMAESLKGVKETLRAIPYRGMPFGLALLRQNDEIQLPGLPDPQIRFNYLGQFDQGLPEKALFSLSQEDIGREVRHPDQARAYEIEIDSWVAEGKLTFHIHYVPGRLSKEAVDEFANHLMSSLRELIDLCTSGKASGFTPSDFQDVDMDQGELDGLMDELDDLDDLD